MQIILSHENLDFDGLASMIAASKLYPEAKLVLPNKQNTMVEQFLAIYRDALHFFQQKEIDWQEVKHIILVDTASIQRLGNLKQLLDPQRMTFTVYDHHQPSADQVTSEGGNSELLGAAVTLLIEEIIEQGLEVSSFEATIMALGLYTDTGYFSYLSTTPRDLRAATFLLENGAKLDLVSMFSEQRLSEEEQQIFQALLQNSRQYQIQGVDILVAWHEQANYVGGLAVLAQKILELSGVDALLLVVEMERRVYLVGRSTTERVEVLSLIKKYDGGGHAKAASATIKKGKLSEIVADVQEQIASLVQPGVSARQMMSSPVKSIAPQTTIDEVAEMIFRYGHTGFPIVEDQQLVGIISRRDIDKAMHHGLGHAPAKGFMSQHPISITPEVSLEEIQQLMIEHNIGRLPVLEQGQVIGIISRSDVLEYMHGQHNQAKHTADGLGSDEKNVTELIEKHLPAAVFQLLKDVAQQADQVEQNIYLVGGIVRDLLLDCPNEDIDLLIEGDAIQFAERLVRELGGKARTHPQFGTATWMTDSGIKLDIVTARTEYYSSAAALPTVEHSSLKDDLSRRDFSINALAIQLNERAFGQLIDYFNGFKDIEEKRIRVLYNLSFVEDPTRILRAVRFEQRLGFLIDEQTWQLACNSIDKMGSLSPTRLAQELRIMLQEKQALQSMIRLDELGFWQVLTNKVEHPAQALSCVSLLSRVNEQVQRLLADAYQGEQLWICYLANFFYNQPDWSQAVEAYALNQHDHNVIAEIEKLGRVSSEWWLQQLSLGEIHKVLKTYSVESILFMLAQTAASEEGILASPILTYLEKRTSIPQWISGADLKALELKPGPIYAQILAELEIAYLNEQIGNKAEALDLVQRLINA